MLGKVMQSNREIIQELISISDQCVMCGLCLPHCPTYSIAKNEAESPRGRISLVRALHEGKLEPDPPLVNHLDNCLACMACEAVCPANVDYQSILDAGREITRDHHTIPYRLKQSLLLYVLTKANARRLTKCLLNLYHFFGVHYVLKRFTQAFPYALRAIKLIQRPQQLSFARLPPSTAVNKIRVIVFNTCASTLFSDNTQTSAHFLLRALDCDVLEYNQSLCCGALHQHSGHEDRAKVLMQEFAESFMHENFDALISLATGCGAQLNRYPEHMNVASVRDFANKHVDINTFVLQQLEKHPLQFKPLAKKVFIHKPCTQKLVADNPDVVEQLLQNIPDIQLSVFQDKLACCGAGGMNSLMQANLADAVIKNKIDELESSSASYLVTSNIGCMLHFQAQLGDSKIIACHPVTLLAQQLLYS